MISKTNYPTKSSDVFKDLKTLLQKYRSNPWKYPLNDSKSLSAAIDHLIKGVVRKVEKDFSPRAIPTFAILAVGGYGRRELFPYADVDFVLVHDGKLHPVIEQLSKKLTYALLDLKLETGFSTLSFKESLKLAKSDFKTSISLLDARFLCGSEKFAKKILSQFRLKVLMPFQKRHLNKILKEMKGRHERFGGMIFLGEPH